MFCTKCGAANSEEEVFCTSCGAVLTGVSLDDPEPEASAAPVPAQPPVLNQQPAYQAPAHNQQTAYAPQNAYPPQPRQRKRKKRNPQGLELAPLGCAALAFIMLFLPWFNISAPTVKGKWSLFEAIFEVVGMLGDLGFTFFLALAMYLIVLVAPILVAFYSWRRQNNYMGLSLSAVLAAFFAWIFTLLGFKSLVGSVASKYIKVTPHVGFYLYILCVAAVIAVGVMISMQRQKKHHRPRNR